MLGLLAAGNDLGISFKLWAPFILVPAPADPTYSLYQTSHMTYFMRLVMAQVYEAWTVFNKGRNSGDPIIKQVYGNTELQKILGEMRAALGVEFEDAEHSPAEFFRRCRVATFHYYDEEVDAWPEQLKVIGSEPMIIAPQPLNGLSKSTDTRYIVADEWINSRLSPSGFGNPEMHKDALYPVAFKFLNLIERSTIIYLRARGINGLDAEVVPAKSK